MAISLRNLFLISKIQVECPTAQNILEVEGVKIEWDVLFIFSLFKLKMPPVSVQF
jgi:hypothetical protein